LGAEQLPAHHIALPGDEDIFYGYGLMSYESRGARVVTHGGASRGYGSTIQIVPAARFAVIVLTNKSGETLARTRAKAMELALPLKAEADEAAPKATAMTEGEMADYAGLYAHDPQTWEVFIKQGKLFLKYENAEFQLTKVGPRTFSFAQGGLVFVAGKDGKTEHLFTGLYAARKRIKRQ
jgi:CubicO group peptidase (beta-lactamase class C family)